MSKIKVYFALSSCFLILVGCGDISDTQLQHQKSSISAAELLGPTQAGNPVQRLLTNTNSPSIGQSAPSTILNTGEGFGDENPMFGASLGAQPAGVDPLGNGLPPWYCTARYLNHNLQDCQNYPVLPTPRNPPWPDPIFANYYYGLGYGDDGYRYDDDYRDREYRRGHRHNRSDRHIHSGHGRRTEKTRHDSHRRSNKSNKKVRAVTRK